MPTGVVTGIFRDGDPQDPGSPIPYVEASIAGAGVQSCRYYGNPPPPLSVCEFTDVAGTWFCEGAKEYDLRRVLHEDFTTCSTVTVSGTALVADTPWGTALSGTSAQIAALTGSGLGVARLTSGTTVNRSALIVKTVDAILPSAADAYWLHTKAKLGTSAVDIDTYIGLSDGSAASDYVFARWIPSVNTVWSLSTLKDGVAGGATSATAGAVDGYHDFDLIFVPGIFAALWVDGDGPYAATSNIPAGTDTLTVFARCVSTTAATKTLDVDFVTLTAINGDLAHPTEHDLLT